MPTREPIVVSAAAEAQYKTPWDKKLAGHRVVVTGLYFAKPPNRDYEGAARGVQVEYREEFVLDPHEHRLEKSVCLGHVLAPLAERLRAKDPNFRGVSTHVLAEHENIFVKP